MFDNCYFDYYGKTEKNVYGQGVVSEIELWIDDNQSPLRKVGTVLKGEYECKVFDNQGNLLIKDKCDRNGNYETAERMPDGTLSEKSGTSIFIRCINGKII